MSRKHIFPHPIARFSELEGGLYGTVDLIARTRERLEFQLGADFVYFSRKEADELREAVTRFLEIDAERDSAESISEEVVAVVAEERSRGRAPRRRARETV